MDQGFQKNLTKKSAMRSLGIVAKVLLITFIIMISGIIGIFLVKQNPTATNSISSATSSTTLTSQLTHRQGVLDSTSNSKLGYIARATFYAAGNYYVFYSNQNSTVGKFSQDGTTWNTVASNFSLPRNSILYWNGKLLYAAFSENTSMYLRIGTPLPSGLNWNRTYVYSVSANISNMISPVSIRVDSLGSIWIAYSISDGPNASLNYFVTKIDILADQMTLSRGFPYFVGTGASQDYHENSFNIATLSDGGTVLIACGVGPNSSSFLREWKEGNWSSPVEFEYPCGLNPNSLFEGEAVGSIISALSANSSVELLYYAAQASCDACSYTNASVLVIHYTNNSFSVSRLIYNSNGAFLGATAGSNFLWANSALNGQYNGSLSKNVYIGTATGLYGDLFTINAAGGGVTSSLVASNSSGSETIVLYSIQMRNGSSSIDFEKGEMNALHNSTSSNSLSLARESIYPVFPLIPVPMDPIFAGNTAWSYSENTVWQTNISALINNDSASIVHGYEDIFPKNFSSSSMYFSPGTQFLYNASTMLLCQTYSNGSAIAFFNLQKHILSRLIFIGDTNKFACSVSTDGRGILYSIGPNGSLEEYDIQNLSISIHVIPLNVQLSGADLLVDNSTNPPMIYYEVGNLTPSISYGIVKMNSAGGAFGFFPLPHPSNFVLMDLKKNIWVSSGLGNTTLMELNTTSGNLTTFQIGMNVFGAILTPRGLWTIDIGRSLPTVLAFFSFESDNVTKSINLTGNQFIDVMTPGKGCIDNSGNLWFYLWYGTLGCGGSEPCEGVAAYFVRAVSA